MWTFLRKCLQLCAQKQTLAGIHTPDVLLDHHLYHPAGICQTALRMSVCCLTDPGHGATATGSSLTSLVLWGRHIQVPWTSHIPLHLVPLWSGWYLRHLPPSVTFLLGPVVKGMVPQSGIQTVKSALRVQRTRWSQPCPGLSCCWGPELSQLSLPNCLLTTEVGKGLLLCKDLGRMEVFCLDLESKVLEPSTELLASIWSLACHFDLCWHPIPSLKHLARNEGGLGGGPELSYPPGESPGY